MNGPVIIMLLGVSRVLQQDKVEHLEQCEACVCMHQMRERQTDNEMPHRQGVVLSDKVAVYCVTLQI